jgi:hypothetical protein
MSWVGVSELLVLPNGECFSLGKERSTERGGRVHARHPRPRLLWGNAWARFIINHRRATSACPTCKPLLTLPCAFLPTCPFAICSSSSRPVRLSHEPALP